MQVNPYVVFNGNCAEALKFYEECGIGRNDGMLKHAGTPAESHVPAEWHDKIMHARLVIGDSVLMASDAPPEHYKKPQGFSVSLQFKDATEAQRIFNALSAGGQVRMPFGETFWSPGFGMLTDRFGIPWMINTEGDH